MLPKFLLPEKSLYKIDRPADFYVLRHWSVAVVRAHRSLPCVLACPPQQPRSFLGASKQALSVLCYPNRSSDPQPLPNSRPFNMGLPAHTSSHITLLSDAEGSSLRSSTNCCGGYSVFFCVWLQQRLPDFAIADAFRGPLIDHSSNKKRTAAASSLYCFGPVLAEKVQCGGGGAGFGVHVLMCACTSCTVSSLLCIN